MKISTTFGAMKFLDDFGEYILMLRNMAAKPEKFSMYWKEFIRQINQIGVGSLVIVSIVSVFIGAVTAVQFGYQIQATNMPIPMSFLGYVVRESMILELAPTISCLLLAGKVGSNISTELGTMRNSEQIDALEIMGVNTTAYLVGPKIFGGVFIIPFLVIISAALGIMGGWLAGALSGLITSPEYLDGLTRTFGTYGTFVMLIKALIFAFLITSISCFQGYYVKGGSIAIGNASTRAVVNSSIAILLSDYIIAAVLL